MKAPVFGSILLLLVASAAAQDFNLWQKNPSGNFILNPDKEAIQKWPDQSRPAKRNWRSGSVKVWIADDLDSTCATMRTYRRKREGDGSDVTRPSGYATCVPMARFRVEDAVALPADEEPAD